MLIPKWIVCCGIFLIFCARISLAQENKQYGITLEGNQVSSEINSIEKNGSRYVNLPFLRKYFRVATSWSPSNNELYFKLGTYAFKLFANKTSYIVNGSSRTLPAAPFEKNNEFWIPLDFVTRLGMTVNQDSDQKIDLNWNDNYLICVENISYQEKPAFLLSTNKNFTIKHYILNEPERLVCEIDNFKAHFTLNDVIPSSHPLVKQVRIKKGDKSIQVIFELKKTSSYKLVQDPKQPNTSILLFNYLVEDVQLAELRKGCKIGIKTSLPADYKVFYQPNQITVKLYGATFNAISKTVLENDTRFSSIKINQDDFNIVSVIFTLATNSEYFVTRSPLNPNVIELKDKRTIKEVTLSKTETGSTLTITGDGELTEDTRLLGSSKKLRLDFPCAQFDPKLQSDFAIENHVAPICLIALTPNLARIEMDFTHLPSYKIGYSEDRSQVTVEIENSTMIGKTIVLDPGHGGIDTGACGKQETREKDLNLEVALKLKNYLELAGAEVLLTRNGDSFIGLYERCYFSNYQKADLFISIHTNSHPNTTVHGIEVFYYNDQERSLTLATRIFEKITARTKLTPLGVKTARFVVIRETQMPSALVELGFLSNYQEESTLRTTAFKENAALGIFQGIADFFKSLQFQ